jgi:cell division septum initiation protein DivIVA
MAWPGDFLNRFRPAGTPGAAARAGVPVDRPAEAAAELEPILALLAEAESAGVAIRERARQDAKGIREQARARADSLVAEARARAEGERAVTAAGARARGQAESARLTGQAERRAAARREWAEQRMPGYVARMVAMVRTAGEEAGTTGRGSLR